MAHLVPNATNTAGAGAGAAAEAVTLELLQNDLPDDYTIFHGVYWADEADRSIAIGELDFVVINQSGAALLIEQKAGELIESEEGLTKSYGGTEKSVANQIHRALGHIKDKWSRGNRRTKPLDIGYLLYIPHHELADVNAAGIAPERIVDAVSRADLPERIEQMLGRGIERDGTRREVHQFFRQELRLVPSLDHAIDLHARVYEELASGVAELGERLEMTPWRLRVVGRAGSGKSQLALRTADRSVRAGYKTLYVCFNRPLAERVQASLDGPTVDTFHGFCRRLLESRGYAFDVSRTGEPDFWREVEQSVAELVAEDSPAYDMLVVDEGQDFDPEWYEILRTCLTGDAAILWVEDPLQNLGGRQPCELHGFVTYRTDENHRSPPAVRRALDKWLGIPCRSSNDLHTEAVHCYEYHDEEGQADLLDQRINALVEAGFKPESIVVLSAHGLGKSALANARSVGGYPMRRATGEYTEEGRQIYTDGRIQFDSIYRFKGHQAPAVIVTEVDFPNWRDERAARVLYTAMTRAQRHLEIHRPS